MHAVVMLAVIVFSVVDVRHWLLATFAPFGHLVIMLASVVDVRRWSLVATFGLFGT
jgi:hypothetical protein